jgi:phage repressor protein C with HTH and peptisase S24 domain
MKMASPRLALDQLIRENNDDYRSLSRLLGRNPSYIQQFIKRGTPRKLDECDRENLARHFRVNESLIGGPANAANTPSDFIEIPLLNIAASAGSSSSKSAKTTRATIAFDKQWLRQLTCRANSSLLIIRISGDSMEPTLRERDQAIVNLDCAHDVLSDGIYVLRMNDAIVVKRISVDPNSKAASIMSDNCPRFRI